MAVSNRHLSRDTLAHANRALKLVENPNTDPIHRPLTLKGTRAPVGALTPIDLARLLPLFSKLTKKHPTTLGSTSTRNVASFNPSAILTMSHGTSLICLQPCCKETQSKSQIPPATGQQKKDLEQNMQPPLPADRRVDTTQSAPREIRRYL